VAQIEVQIVRNGNVVSFQPTPQPVTSVDILFWSNTDEQQAHQPAPVDNTGKVTNAAAWMPKPIPAKLKDQDAPCSRGLTFDPPSTSGTPYNVSYACALHPTVTSEKGVIKVNS